MTPPPKPRPSRWIAELPLFLGLMVGWLRLWWAGKAMVLNDQIGGYSWPEYLGNAWMVVHGEDVGYDVFREPVPAWIQGIAGELVGSYPSGAILLSSLCAGALVLGAGLLARALGSSWAGGVAAVAVTLSFAPLDLPHWANHYPLQAAGMALALGFGACFARWPRPTLALGAGLGVALALSLDSRGLAALVPAAALILVGLSRPQRWIRRVLLLGAFLLGLASHPASEASVWRPRRKVPTAEAKLDIQQRAVQRWIQDTRDPGLEAACGSLDSSLLLGVEALQTPCSEALRRWNGAVSLPRHAPFGVLLTFLGLGLALLPGRGGWRQSASSLAALGGASSSLIILAGWAPLPDRYYLLWASTLAAIAPVGLSRLVQTLPLARLHGRLPAITLAGALAGLLAWAWWTDPAQRDMPTTQAKNTRYLLRLEAAAAARRSLQPGDRFLDCSELSVAVQLLPSTWQEGPPTLRPTDNRECLAWLRSPELGDGSTWVITEAPRSGRGPREQDILEGVHAWAEASTRWSSEWEGEGPVLWRLVDITDRDRPQP